MAAPTVSSRSTPTGYKMPDGFKTLISFNSIPTVKLWEKDVKPPGLDGGDKIDTTTMHNVAWRTSSPRHLKTMTDCTFNSAYDPDVISDIFTLINKEDSITIHFPEHSTLCFYGFLKDFQIQDHKEGEMPMAQCTICCTNWDPTNYQEEAPVFAAAAGT